MNYFAALLAFPLLSNALWAEEETTKVSPLLPNLEQFEIVEKVPVGLVTAFREKQKWRFSIPCDYSVHNSGSRLEKVVLRGEGFEIPIGVRVAWGQVARTEFTMTDKMRESAVLEIWIRSWSNLGNYAAHYRIKLSEITPKSEQDGADQPATAPKSKSEDKKKPKPESEGRPQ